MREREKMVTGALYDANDAELQAEQGITARWLERYNASSTASVVDRHALLRERFGSVGAGAVIRPPFQCDYGFNIHIGAGAFINFNAVILDVTTVTIGAGTLIGPGVQVLAADHPRDPVVRRSGLELGRPVVIGDNVWIGAGALILPGVTIGDDAIVGAGAVVTKDVAAGSTVVGNPARPRPVTTSP